MSTTDLQALLRLLDTLDDGEAGDRGGMGKRRTD